MQQASMVIDPDWHDEALAWGWPMPAPAHPLLRAWGVRHLRSVLLVVHAYIALVPSAPDWRLLWQREWRARGIWHGWC